MIEGDKGHVPQPAQGDTLLGNLAGLLRESRLARLAVVGGAAFATAASAELAVNYADALSVDPNGILQYPCYVGRPDYNAKRCGVSRDAAEQSCVEQMTQVTGALLATKSGYVNGSREDYKVTFTSPDPGGCWPGGKQYIKVVQQRRQGPDGTFVNSSKVDNVPLARYRKAQHIFRISTMVRAPYDCSTTTPGSAVRAMVTMGWIPKPRWAPHAKTKQVSLPGPVQNIC